MIKQGAKSTTYQYTVASVIKIKTNPGADCHSSVVLAYEVAKRFAAVQEEKKEDGDDDLIADVA